MSQKKNFIMTNDKETADKLIYEGFQLVSQDNGTYTFLNKLPKNYSLDDITVVCESLKNQKIALNRLPMALGNGAKVVVK